MSALKGRAICDQGSGDDVLLNLLIVHSGPTSVNEADRKVFSERPATFIQTNAMGGLQVITGRSQVAPCVVHIGRGEALEKVQKRVHETVDEIFARAIAIRDAATRS